MWDTGGLTIPGLVPCRVISACEVWVQTLRIVPPARNRESNHYVQRERCIHGFLMLAMIGCLFLSCSATDFLHSTSDTAEEEQLGNQ